MIGPFGFEPAETYQRKHGTLLADEVCICKDCLAAGIALPSIMSVEHKQRVDLGDVVKEMYMGRWLHGLERKQYEEKRAEFAAAVARMRSHVYTMPEVTEEDIAAEERRAIEEE